MSPRNPRPRAALKKTDLANEKRLLRLEEKGVVFPEGSAGLFVGAEVDPARIEAGAVLHPGCRITGEATLIRSGAQVGITGPCTLHDMVLDRKAALGSGAFDRSVLLHGVRLGSSVRVRENCLLEEGCEASFSVDLKHTFLLANVVMGSEINFCDLLMAGGTSRRDHSEVGSGVIHFNFTPFGASGDKATASLIGDVRHGVFYRSKRIFIGGHTSLVGPLKIGYGAVIAAGSRVASDVGERVLCYGESGTRQDILDFDFLRYRGIARKVRVNVEYIAELSALWHFYAHARRAAAADPLEEEILRAALRCIEGGIETRVDRMDAFAGHMPESAARNRAAGEDGLAARQEAFHQGWPAARERLLAYRQVQGDEEAREALLERLGADAGSSGAVFTERILRDLDPPALEKGQAWLKSIVDELRGAASGLAPGLE